MDVVHEPIEKNYTLQEEIGKYVLIYFLENLIFKHVT